MNTEHSAYSPLRSMVPFTFTLPVKVGTRWSGSRDCSIFVTMVKTMSSRLRWYLLRYPSAGRGVGLHVTPASHSGNAKLLLIITNGDGGCGLAAQFGWLEVWGSAATYLNSVLHSLHENLGEYLPRKFCGMSSEFCLILLIITQNSFIAMVRVKVRW